MVSFHYFSAAATLALIATASAIDALPSQPTTLSTATAEPTPISATASLLPEPEHTISLGPGIVLKLADGAGMRATGNCSYDTGVALANWRFGWQCAKMPWKIFYKCWNRAPRLDRCCEKDDTTRYLKKPAVTCKMMLPELEADWIKWKDYPPV